MNAATAPALPSPANNSALRMRRQRRRDGVRLVAVEVPEGLVREAIARGLLEPEERSKPWTLIQACYASVLSDATLDWLTRNEMITSDQRTDTVAILRHQFMKEPQLFGPNLLNEGVNAGGSAGPGQTGDKTKLDRVFGDAKDNRNCRGCIFGRK